MSYRNPQIIRDRTAEVYVQGAKDLTNIFIKGIESRGAYLAEQADKKRKEDERWTLNANRNSRIINKENKITGDLINTISGSWFDDYQVNIKDLGNPAMQAITNNDVTTDLTIEQRQANDDIYLKYDNYNTTSRTLMGKILAEKEEHYGEKDGDGGLSSSRYGTDWNYVGNNDGERAANMFIINSLNNTDASSTYGGTMSKSGNYDKKGNSNATFITKIPTDNKDFLDFMPTFVRGKMDDKTWEAHKEKNGIVVENGQFIFRRVINNENFGKGFVMKTMAGPSSEDMLVKPGIVTKTGLSQDAFITDKLNAKIYSVSSEVGGRKITSSNKRRFIDNSFFVGESAKNWDVALTKAEAIVGMNDTQRINNYLRNRLDIIDPEEVMNEGVYDSNLIAKHMQMKTQRDGLNKGGYSSKIADKEDIDYYKTQDIEIGEKELIWYQEIKEKETYDKEKDDDSNKVDSYMVNKISNIMNLKNKEDDPDYINSNIKTLSKELGNKANALGQSGALKIQEEAVAAAEKKYGKGSSEVTTANQTLSTIKNSGENALWIAQGSKLTEIIDYDPTNPISQLEILRDFGNISAAQKRMVESQIAAIRAKYDEFQDKK